MDLSFIPNMNADVETIIFKFKQNLDDFQSHKLKMQLVFLELKLKLKCIKCYNYRQFHVFDHNNTNKYIRSPICYKCLLDLQFVDLYDIIQCFDPQFTS